MTPDAVLVFLCLNDRGGAEMSMITVAQGLARRGRRVTLAVYGAHPELARFLGFDGEVVDLGARRTVAVVWRLARLLRARCFTAVISALPHTNIAAAIAAFMASPRSRLIVTEHGFEGIAACRRSPLFAALARFCYGRGAAVVAVSRGLAQAWRDFLPPRAAVTVIYNPVVADIATSTPPPAHAWLATKEIPVIIGIGRLQPEKNFWLLVAAFARVVAHRPARLIILGEGEQRPLLEQQARALGVADTILLPGFQGDTAAWLAHAALFVSASNREGFGNAIVEALAQGISVVATDCPCGPGEILQGGRYGRLVPINDVEALARAMTQVMDAAPDRDLWRARAQDFTVSRCIDAYLALVDNEPSS